MSRYAPIITMDEFKDKCNKTFNIDTDGFNPHDGLSSTIKKDISKVNFDFENYEIGNADPNYGEYSSKGFNGYPCGYQLLPNNLPVMFVNAGGDWEYPICFCIYWDGKK